MAHTYIKRRDDKGSKELVLVAAVTAVVVIDNYVVWRSVKQFRQSVMSHG